MTKASNITDGKYQADKNGIVHIPTLVFDTKKDYIVKVFDNKIDISESMRYTGSVYRTKSIDSSKYELISFYLPSLNERSIENGTQYWRDKMYQYKKESIEKFDSLLRVGKIVYDTPN